jgi:TonB family protein
LTFHGSLVAFVLGYGLVMPSTRVRWGDPTGGGLGAVVVTPVNTIPIASRTGPVNPVANDTESYVPPAVAKAKPEKKVLPPIPDAVPLPSRNASRHLKPIPPAAAPNKWAEAHPPAPNQFTSSYGQRATSSMYSVPGGGGVGVGTSSAFGTQFGAYATLLRDRIAQNWHTNDVDARVQTAPPVTVVFTIRRNGSLVPGSARVAQSSGNHALDYSTLRAIMDAAPFQELPSGYNKDQAELELRFELRR